MIARAVSGFLIVGILFFGSPLSLVFAEGVAGSDGGNSEQGGVQEGNTDSSNAPVSGGIVSPDTDVSEGGVDEGGGVATGAEDPAGSVDEGGGAVVETGDAVASVDIENKVNTNDTDTENQNSNTKDTDTENIVNTDNGDGGGDVAVVDQEDNKDSSTGETENTDNGDVGSDVATVDSSGESSTGTTTIAVVDESEAVVGNDTEVNANTGGNSASGGDGSAVVDTGNAIASANVVNVVNTNITNSHGLLLLLNALFGSGSFDLRDFNFGWSSGDKTPTYTSLGGESSDQSSATSSALTTPTSCDLNECEGGNIDLAVTSTSTAEISNEVVVRSSTGKNNANGGNSYIKTGNSYAGANVVNVANSNLVNSNYLLVSINNFGNFNGDIVFPGLSFFKKFFNKKGGQNGNTTVSNTNTAKVDNKVSVDADTGGNSADGGEGKAVVETGDASASANVTNVVNSNLFGGDSVQILLRVQGSWSGNIFGLPDGISWKRTPQGVRLFSTPKKETGSGEGNIVYKSLNSSNKNKATINNNVKVFALTGKNQVSGESEAVVKTGDASAGANVTNIVNTNVVGRNWILAIFNILGDWNGNLSFGRPDLWVGARAESSSNPLRPGSLVKYTFTVTNFGDAKASGVVLKNMFNKDFLSFSGYDSELTSESGVAWNLDTLAPGESKEISFTAKVANDIPNGGDTSIAMKGVVSSVEKDENLDDNSEEISVIAVRNERKSWVSQRDGLPYADLKIRKSANVSETVASSTVNYTIVVNNYGTSAYNATLYDTLRDEEGKTVVSQSWPLGEIYPDEEITVTYTTFFNASTTAGVYTNSAQVKGVDTRTLAKGGNANSKIVQSVITVVNRKPVKNKPEICSAYLKSYIRPGGTNNTDDVSRLQQFLIANGYAKLSVTGEYNTDTQNAVRGFQERYRSLILSPWGIANPTGYVYYTTQKQINELYCGGEEVFPLSNTQQSEISTFVEKLKKLQENGEPIDTSEVGFNASNAQAARLSQESGERDLFPKGTSVRSLMAGVAETVSSATEKRKTNLVEQIKKLIYGVMPWISEKFNLSEILSANR